MKKCSNCKKELPQEFDAKEQRALWFGKYDNDKIIEIICRECWEKGVRYSK
jgi:hypothetical protein